jgi:hypothetical protein
VWAEAAKWLSKFDEAVLTGVDAEGYPVSIRVNPRDYDAATGTLPASFPAALPAVEGPANVLAHSHDEKLWHLNMIQIKGRLASRDAGWVFESTNFDAPSKLAFVEFLRANSAAAHKYLNKRGLKRPPVDWKAVKEIQRRAKAERPPIST